MLPLPEGEPLLAPQAWQTLLEIDPLRARRRYWHQVTLTFTHTSSLSQSVRVFQQLTNRRPHTFLAQAHQLVPHILSMPAEQVFAQINQASLDATNPYLSFASPYVLFQRVTRSMYFLYVKAHVLGTPITDAVDTPLPFLVELLDDQIVLQESTMRRHEEEMQHAAIRAAWSSALLHVAVVLEEVVGRGPIRAVQAHHFHTSLTPYPNEADWQHLLATDRGAAQHQASQLELEAAKFGIMQPFNLGESIAAFRFLIAQVSADE